MRATFHRRLHGLGGREDLEWIRVRNASPRAMIFVPPLIGGNLSQQVRSFRWLIRRGYDLISFNYSGHGNSSDKFTLGATMRDTAHMLRHTRRLSKQEALPLFGIASCYSAIPALYASHHLGEPLRKLVLVNAIPRVDPGAVLSSFIAYYRSVGPAKGRGLRSIWGALQRYGDALFPGILKNEARFGILERSRAKLFRTVSECFTLDPLDGVRLPRTPVLCLYARRDPILRIYDTAVGRPYQNDILRICPQALFRSLDADHFLSSSPARGEAARSIRSFLSSPSDRPLLMRVAQPSSEMPCLDTRDEPRIRGRRNPPPKKGNP